METGREMDSSGASFAFPDSDFGHVEKQQSSKMPFDASFFSVEKNDAKSFEPQQNFESNSDLNDSRFLEMPPNSSGHQRDVLRKCAEVVLQVLQLNEDLSISLLEENQLLEQFKTGQKKKIKCKLKIFETDILVQSLRGHFMKWNSLWEQSSDAGYSADVTSQLKATLVGSLFAFLTKIYELLRVGLQLVAVQGVHDMPASLLQRLIHGIVVFNSFLDNVSSWLGSASFSFHSVGACLVELLPRSISIRDVLFMIASKKACVFGSVMTALLEYKVSEKWTDMQKVSLDKDWQWCFPAAGHVHHSWMKSPNVESTNNVITSDYSSESSENNQRSNDEASSASISQVDKEMKLRYDNCCTELQTIASQEELDISKLVSVVHLSFMDVESKRSKCHQKWLFLDEIAPQFNCDQRTAHNIADCYRDELERSIVEYLKSRFEDSFALNHENSRSCLGSMLLMSPDHMVELGNCALDICYSLEKQAPTVRVYHLFRSHCYLMAALKTWDTSYCSALASVSNPKCVPVMLANGGYGSYAGKCLIDCMKPIIGIEYLVSTKSDFDVDVIHSAAFPRLLAALEVTCSWLESSMHQALKSWHIGTFSLIVHGDLKRVIDLLKHTVNVNPVQRSLSLQRGNSSYSLSLRESMLRQLAYWENVGKAITRIQNCSSTCMKLFCQACKLKAETALADLMPCGKTWRQRNKHKIIPTECSSYARLLVEDVIAPIVEGVARLPTPVQISMITMATKVFCETWMNFILSKRIKFSLYGAQILNLDFCHLMDFLHSQPVLSMETRQSVQSLEIMRHLRGVTALLLRQNVGPPLALGMRSRKVAPLCDPNEVDDQEDSHQMEGLPDGSDSMTSDSLADEDYVPNKDLWLSLRVNKNRSFSRTPFWCFS